MTNYAYSEQVTGPLNDTMSRRSTSSERASGGTGNGASLCESLESFIDGFDTMGPVEVGGPGSVSERILHAIQDDPADTVWEHCGTG